MNSQWQNEIISILDANHVTLYDLLLCILCGHLEAHSRHRAILQQRTSDILDLWSEQLPSESREWAVRTSTEVYWDEVNKLIQPHTGFQFRGTKANMEQIEGFSMVEMGKSIKLLAPDLWNLLGVLLDANTARRRAAPSAGGPCIDEDTEMDLGEIGIDGEQQNKREEEWAALDDEVVESSDSEEDEELSNDALLGVAGTISDPSAAPAASSDSDSDIEDKMTAPKHAPKKRRHKQKPKKRNAVLIAIVSFIPFQLWSVANVTYRSAS